jgi:hypothetical protein
MAHPLALAVTQRSTGDFFLLSSSRSKMTARHHRTRIKATGITASQTKDQAQPWIVPCPTI